MGVPAHPAAKSKLFPRWWVDYMQRAFSAFQLLAFRPCDREDNIYTLALNLLVGKYKKRSSYCTLGRCRERRTGCQKYFVILELYRCKNIMFLKSACHKTFLCSLSVNTADTVDNNNNSNSNNWNGRCKHRSSKRSAASFKQCDQVTADHYSE